MRTYQLSIRADAQANRRTWRLLAAGVELVAVATPIVEPTREGPRPRAPACPADNPIEPLDRLAAALLADYNAWDAPGLSAEAVASVVTGELVARFREDFLELRPAGPIDPDSTWLLLPSQHLADWLRDRWNWRSDGWPGWINLTPPLAIEPSPIGRAPEPVRPATTRSRNYKRGRATGSLFNTPVEVPA